MKCLRLTRVERLPDFAQKLTFVDGSVQTADFGPLLAGSLALAGPAIFATARRLVEGEGVGTVEWPGYPDRGEYALV